nr:transposase (putative), gypsy type [Tanacetum cinerariifolium]
CAELDARLDALSIDFDEELYPHMLMAIAGRRWVIGHGLRLAMMKCAESFEMRQAFADVVSAGVAKAPHSYLSPCTRRYVILETPGSVKKRLHWQMLLRQILAVRRKRRNAG